MTQGKRHIRIVEKELQWRIFWSIAGGMMLVLIIAVGLAVRLLQTIKFTLAYVPPLLLDQVMNEAVEAMALTFLLMGVIISVGGYYSLIMGHRIAGPIYRIKEDLKKMAETGEVFEIHTRKGDGLCSLRDALNELLPKLARKR